MAIIRNPWIQVYIVIAIILSATYRDDDNSWLSTGFHWRTMTLMIKLNIRNLAAGAGIGNPLVFSRQSGLAYAMCYKLWNDQQTRIDLTTIDRLCEVLRCSPGELFVRDPSPLRKGEEAAMIQGTGHEVGKSTPSTASINCRRIRWID